MALQSLAAALEDASADLSLDAKRRPTQSGMDSWYPYYAGYPRSFAERVLRCVPLAPGATVVDPWNGSGTTTYVADQLGFRALGFDLNPVATLVASAKLARADDAAHVVGMAQRIARQVQRGRELPNRRDPLHGWLMPATTSEYRRIEREVLADLATDAMGRQASQVEGNLPPLASFLLLALMRTARAIAGIRTTSNPTWIIKEARSRMARPQLAESWVRTVTEMAADFSSEPAVSGARSENRLGDATALPLNAAEADFVLTSPPYCTRIDYVVSTSFELAAMGIGSDSEVFRRLRRSSMGTPLVREAPIQEPSNLWPATVADLLIRIRQHPSKASASYYYKTYWQYFFDCYRSLAELKRILKPAACAVLVVQSSFYKEIHVDLPKLYAEIGARLGLRASTICEFPVRRALAQINTRSRAHRPSTSYYEAVMALEKTI